MNLDRLMRINRAIRQLQETGVPTMPQLHESHAGLQQVQNLCHDLAAHSGWWNRKMPVLPDNQQVREQMVRLLDETGFPLGHKLTTAEILGAVPEKLCLIHSEISEAMEGHRRNLQDDKLPHRPMVEVELADALIRIMDLAGALKLDLAGAVIEKLAFNQQRADHKPEARKAAGGKQY